MFCYCWVFGLLMVLFDESVCCFDGLVVWLGLFDVCIVDCLLLVVWLVLYVVRDVSIRVVVIRFCFMLIFYVIIMWKRD